MARRSTSTTRTLLPLDRGEWQEEDAELKTPVADDEESDPADEGDSEATVDLDESDELAGDDTAMLVAVAAIGDPALDPGVEALMAGIEADSAPVARKAARRAPGGARRQVEDYWERKRVARALEDLEDFEV